MMLEREKKREGERKRARERERKKRERAKENPPDLTVAKWMREGKRTNKTSRFEGKAKERKYSFSLFLSFSY